MNSIISAINHKLIEQLHELHKYICKSDIPQMHYNISTSKWAHLNLEASFGPLKKWLNENYENINWAELIAGTISSSPMMKCKILL